MALEFFAGAIFYTGLLVNTALALLSAWGLVGFFPRKSTRGESAASWLILAIWLGFLGVFLHSITSGVFGQVVVWAGFLDLPFWHYYVRGLADIIWNVTAGVSIYLHFYARYRSIPEEDQTHWHPLLMGFYPDLTHWAVKTGKKMQALYKGK